MRIGMGSDINAGTITAGTTPGGSVTNANGVSCCTYAQATDPLWSTTPDGNTRYDSKGNYCDPNCDAGYFQGIVNSIFGTGSGTPPASGSNLAPTILIGAVVLFLAKR